MGKLSRWICPIRSFCLSEALDLHLNAAEQSCWRFIDDCRSHLPPCRQIDGFKNPSRAHLYHPSIGFSSAVLALWSRAFYLLVEAEHPTCGQHVDRSCKLTKIVISSRPQLRGPRDDTCFDCTNKLYTQFYRFTSSPYYSQDGCSRSDSHRDIRRRSCGCMSGTFGVAISTSRRPHF